MSLLAARPLASLSSGLLARKGQARPAMRAQGLVSFTDAAPLSDLALDDLGWNDMGAEPAGEVAAVAVSADPAPSIDAVPPVPPVLVERAALLEELERAAPGEAPVAVTAAVPGPSPAPRQRAAGARAAFTLRLDADRHLRLRLASASANRSAQQLLTDALDAMLAAMPQVEALARQDQVGTGERTGVGA